MGIKIRKAVRRCHESWSELEHGREAAAGLLGSGGVFGQEWESVASPASSRPGISRNPIVSVLNYIGLDLMRVPPPWLRASGRPRVLRTVWKLLSLAGNGIFRPQVSGGPHGDGMDARFCTRFRLLGPSLAPNPLPNPSRISRSAVEVT
jgi:hypothetical protein